MVLQSAEHHTVLLQALQAVSIDTRKPNYRQNQTTQNQTKEPDEYVLFSKQLIII